MMMYDDFNYLCAELNDIFEDLKKLEKKALQYDISFDSKEAFSKAYEQLNAIERALEKESAPF